MNKWFLLLILIGLGAVGWYNRETINGWFGRKTLGEDGKYVNATPDPDAPPGPNGPARPTPAPTPNLALASMDQAKKTYPALAMAGSAFQLKFKADYSELQRTNPGYLARPDWPIQLAGRTARELGGAEMPVVGGAAPAPSTTHLMGSGLDKHGPPGAPGASPAQLSGPSGLRGSALDQKPTGGRNH